MAHDMFLIYKMSYNVKFENKARVTKHNYSSFEIPPIQSGLKNKLQNINLCFCGIQRLANLLSSTLCM
jgi:hypothetical protein